MIKKINIICLFVLMFIPVTSFSQEMCLDEDHDALKACTDQCVVDCQAQFPDCVGQPVTLEEVREALAERCVCENARNFGQYRSCVAQLMGALRRFSMVDQEIVQAIAADTKVCRNEIKERKKEARGKTPKMPKA